MKNHVSAYLKEQAQSWAPTTIKSETARMQGLNLDPALAYEKMLSLGRNMYTIKTAFIRYKHFCDFLLIRGIISGPNPYAIFLKQRARAFRNAYVPEHITLSFSD